MVSLRSFVNVLRCKGWWFSVEVRTHKMTHYKIFRSSAREVIPIMSVTIRIEDSSVWAKRRMRHHNLGGIRGNR